MITNIILCEDTISVGRLILRIHPKDIRGNQLVQLFTLVVDALWARGNDLCSHSARLSGVLGEPGTFFFFFFFIKISMSIQSFGLLAVVPVN